VAEKSKFTFSVYYLAGVLFFIYGIYQLSIQEVEESFLYISTGGAFILVGMLQNDILPQYRQILNYLSWIFIAVALLSFLYVLTILPATRNL
jgi:hypothetical protein